MEPTSYFAVLRRRWITLAVLCVLGIVAALGLSAREKKTYQATTTLLFSQAATSAQDLVESFAQVATQPVVLEPVIGQLKLNTTPSRLRHSITAQVPLNTVILEISATSVSAKGAAALANAVADQLAVTIPKLAGAGSAGGAKSLGVSTVALAQAPKHPLPSHLSRNVAGGAALGIVLAICWILGRDRLDPRLRDANEAATYTGSPLLGSVTSDLGQPLLLTGTENAQAEGFRLLRANLFALESNGKRRSVVLTSPHSFDGKTGAAINLAVVAAETGMRVLLVDANLRQPAVAAQLGLDASDGLAAALRGEAQLADVVQQWSGGRNLDVLPAGRAPFNPSELIGSDAMTKLLATVTADYDFVVVDAAPVLSVSDAAVLSQRLQGALIVTDLATTRRPDLEACADKLRLAGARVLGVALSRTVGRRHGTRPRATHAQATARAGQESGSGRKRSAAEPSRRARSGRKSGAVVNLRGPGEASHQPHQPVQPGQAGSSRRPRWARSRP